MTVAFESTARFLRARRPKRRERFADARRSYWEASAPLGVVDFPESLRVHWESNPAFRYEEADDLGLVGEDFMSVLADLTKASHALRTALLEAVADQLETLDPVARREILFLVTQALRDVADDLESEPGTLETT